MNTLDFYRSPDFKVDVIEGNMSSRGYKQQISLTQSKLYQSISGAEIAERMRMLNSAPDIIEHDGYHFEVKRFYNEREATGEDEVSISTISSGISNANGPGNFFETVVATLAAERVAHDRHRLARRRLYVSSAGNGGSSPLTYDEIGDFANTGRLTNDDGHVTPWAAALGAALKDYGIKIRHIDTDSFGGILATALGAASNDIKTVYQNGRPQLFGRSRAAFIAGMCYEGRRGTVHNEQLRKYESRKDTWAVRQGNKDWAARLAPNVFAPDGGITLDRDSIVRLTAGICRGPRIRTAEDPLLADMSVLLRANMLARVVLVNGIYDQQTPQEILSQKRRERRLYHLASALSRISREDTSLVAVLGNHSWHTYNPALRHEIKSILLQS